MYDEDLGEVFGFTESDLDYNRQMKLSPDQESHIWRQQVFFLGITGVPLMLLLGFFMSEILNYKTGEGLKIINADMMPALAFLSLCVGVLFTAAIWWFALDLCVSSVEGEARLYISGGFARMYVKGYGFSVSVSQYNVVEDGKTYRVYFLTPQKDVRNQKTAFKWVLSLEEL